MAIIAVDFDGTCVAHDFPRIGKDIGAVPVLKALTDKGHRLILFTMRSHREKAENLVPGSLGWNNPKSVKLETDVLDDAVNWFKKNNIPLWGINENPNQKSWTSSPKPFANLYIDDAAYGVPLTYNPNISNRVYVDWVEIEENLKNAGIL